MKTTIDAAGRVVVPKALRRAIGLQPGSEVEMRVSDGRIEMEPAPLDVRMERTGRNQEIPASHQRQGSRPNLSTRESRYETNPANLSGQTQQPATGRPIGLGQRVAPIHGTTVVMGTAR